MFDKKKKKFNKYSIIIVYNNINDLCDLYPTGYSYTLQKKQMRNVQLHTEYTEYTRIS